MTIHWKQASCSQAFECGSIEYSNVAFFRHLAPSTRFMRKCLRLMGEYNSCSVAARGFIRYSYNQNWENMSYDLYLFTPEAGVDPSSTAIQLMEQEEETGEINSGEPHPEYEQRKQTLVEALLETNPNLETFTFGFSEIAASQGISETEARKRFRHIELNGPEDNNGIQITLFDTTASITVPYWHRGSQAQHTWNEIWDYLRLFQQKAGFVAYDPQLEKVLDLSSDLQIVVSIYESVMNQIG